MHSTGASPRGTLDAAAYLHQKVLANSQGKVYSMNDVLKGDRKGQYSIHINDQWRICFKWSGGDAYDVEITDYH